MLDSLNSLKDRLEDDDLNASSISIDSPAVNNNSTGNSDNSTARQMEYTHDEDSAPPSVSWLCIAYCLFMMLMMCIGQ